MNDTECWHRLTEDLWTYHVELDVLGAEAGRRGVVVRYAPGRWAFIGPVPLLPAARKELDAQGVVDVLIQQTSFHNSFVAEACDEFPEALVYTARGSKRAQLPKARKRFLPDDLPAEFTTALQPIQLREMRAGHETVFFHHASRSLLIADLLMNHTERASSLWSAVARRMFGWGPGARMPRLYRTILKDRSTTIADIDRMLEFPIERIVMSHGSTIESGAREVLKSVRDTLR